MRALLPALVAATCLAACPSARSDERPNIILLMADDMGYGDPQCFNPDSPIRTPHLDAMAARGMRLTRFYAAAPVCSPTRGSCLTGRHPSRYGIPFANTGHMKPEEHTLPEILRDGGYSTGHFGKWHLGTLTTKIKDANRGGPQNKQHFAPPREHGYDDSFVTESKVPTFDAMWKPKGAGRTAWDPLANPEVDGERYGTHFWRHDGTAETEHLDGDESRVLMDRAIPFIRKAATEHKPFFAVVWFHAPHLPVVAGERHRGPYAEHGVYERNYYGCITALDEQVGRLNDTLNELGIADDTIVWYCSDNGPEGQTGKAPGSAGPLRGRKRSLYEGGIRVPAIVVWPGHVPPGSSSGVPMVTSDYLPTLLEITGLKLPDNRPLDGESMLQVITGHQDARQRPIGFASRGQTAVTDTKYKLYRSSEKSTWELYDLTNDTGEKHDLAAEQPDEVRRLAQWAATWQKSCAASDRGADYKVAERDL